MNKKNEPQQSKYDPTRKTVGGIYLDAQKSSDKHVEVGDMTNEIMSSLVEDLNETIASDPFKGRSFYITVHEKKDLQMKNALLRRMITTLYRPYPEDDTLVFWVEPNSNEVKFCWCLPHWSEMDNMLANHTLFDKNLISEIRAWKNNDLTYFGFVKDGMGEHWIPNPNFKDKNMVKPQPKIITPTNFI